MVTTMKHLSVLNLIILTYPFRCEKCETMVLFYKRKMRLLEISHEIYENVISRYAKNTRNPKDFARSELARF